VEAQVRGAVGRPPLHRADRPRVAPKRGTGGDRPLSQLRLPVAAGRGRVDLARIVVVLWIALAAASVAAVGPADRSFEQQFSLPGKEAFAANREIAETYGNGGDVAPARARRLPAGGQDGRLAGRRGRPEAGDDEDGSGAAACPRRVYASTHDRGFVSADGRTTFALVSIPATGGIDPGQAEARAAQAAVDGLTVGGAPVQVTGLDALRATAAGGGGGQGASLAIEALIAGGGALLVLAFVFAS
jgi:putative drug exporter of the RND superfamily